MSEAADPTGLARTQLFSGFNASSWPDMKWQRAAVHLSDLEGRFLQWTAGSPYRLESSLQPDKRTIHSHLKVVAPPPLEEWALILGDFLHNLRSVLDALAWELATFEGAQPSRPTRVQFPIAVKAELWDAAVRDWVGELPQLFAERLSLLQPFRYAEAGKHSALEVLHSLDIQDKHKSALRVAMSQGGVEMRGGFQLADPSAPANLTVELAPAEEQAEGRLVMTFRSGAEVVDDLSLFAPAFVPVLTVDVNGTYVALHELGEMMLTEVRRYIEIIRLGPAPTNEDEQWSPLPVINADGAPAN